MSAVERLRLQRGAEHIYTLGPRAYAELFEEVGAATGTTETMLVRLEAYARLTPEMLRATGGDRFPRPLRVVAK